MDNLNNLCSFKTTENIYSMINRACLCLHERISNWWQALCSRITCWRWCSCSSYKVCDSSRNVLIITNNFPIYMVIYIYRFANFLNRCIYFIMFSKIIGIISNRHFEVLFECLFKPTSYSYIAIFFVFYFVIWTRIFINSNTIWIR